MTSRFSQVFCVPLPVPTLWGNNKIRYRFQGGVVGAKPRTIQSCSQDVAARVFPLYSSARVPLLCFIFSYVQKEEIKVDNFLLDFRLMRGLLLHSSILGQHQRAVELRSCLGGLQPATHTWNTSCEDPCLLRMSAVPSPWRAGYKPERSLKYWQQP